MFKVLNDPFKRRLTISYVYDWLLVVIMTAVFFAIDKITPFHRMFSIEDKTIMFPHTEKETVPVWLLVIICLLIPAVIIGAISLSGIGYKRSLHDFHSGILGLCLGLSMTIMLTDIIKITAGRPRPDMLSRCKPPPTAVDPQFGLLSVDICTTDIHSSVMIDGFKSFPSGHSSFSFSGLGYLAFYIAGKMKMFDEKGHTYKGFIFAFPIIGALLVAISRTEDYRHHWQDVTIGALLGTFCAYFAYRQYYPSLATDGCRDPYLTRVAHIKKCDEELGMVHHSNGGRRHESDIALLQPHHGIPKDTTMHNNYDDYLNHNSENDTDHMSLSTQQHQFQQKYPSEYGDSSNHLTLYDTNNSINSSEPLVTTTDSSNNYIPSK
ncbi:phosphatidic acid phosphatase type 2/haloperoxidase [Mycotypha africana]|uniref:phosphatidic acid phosphatase type 2/haloperoxidase n=1 Tax=Mycotypha africana TaxID=64632 RepID=UPI0023001FDB|nr:phosphatidic acid phosphatase type 2/haloperoxidase [Mycotypha africana]KAI8977246.1 phosphatidic acid phosphatase type 2/haloperoxidase [Mycotypha africana]